MFRKVHLLGELSTFGDYWEMDATCPADIFKLIECQEQKFRPFLIKALEAGLDLAIVTKDVSMSEPHEMLLNNFGGEEVYISLAPTGSRKGWGRLLLAAVLIVVGTIIQPGTGTTIGAKLAGAAQGASFAIGAGLAIQGITQLLTKVPDSDAEERNLGIFDGPVSTVKQGTPVPILYGQLLVGGAPIHTDLTLPQSPTSSYSLPGGNVVDSNLNFTEGQGDFNFGEATGGDDTWDQWLLSLTGSIRIGISI